MDRPFARALIASGLIALSLSFAARGDDQPQAVSVGQGSYASFPPNITDPKLQQFLLGPVHVDASVADRPVPTNKWWSNLLMDKYPGNLWAYPLVVNADEKSLEIFAPKGWNDSGGDILLSAPLRLTGVPPAQKSDVEILANFEGDAYPTGWNGQGAAFGTGPAKGAIEGETPVDGYEGQSLASSFHGGDRSVGELDSPDFRIDRKTIHFLIGGGKDPANLHIDLVVNNAVVCTATGENSEHLEWKSWDVSQWEGQVAQIHIVDQATGGWGHILIDQIVATDNPSVQPQTSDAFSPSGSTVMNWGDWTVTFRLANGPGPSMDTTVGRGMPMVWSEFAGMNPRFLNVNAADVTDGQGNPLTLPATADSILLENDGHLFGIFVPPGTKFALSGTDLNLTFTGNKRYVVSALLPDKAHAALFAKYARGIPRDSRFSWIYDPAKAQVTTKFDLTIEPLDGQTTDTLQGWLPHHYRDTIQQLALGDYSYLTPRGALKVAPGHSFEITYPFTGMLPALPAPSEAEARLDHPFDLTRMQYYLDGYAKDHADKPKDQRYGGDTYWGGKDLTNYGQYLAICDELKDTDRAAVFHNVLHDAMTDWLTYTPGETAHYFARYDKWKAMVGYHGSYGSEMFTDNHFHYGYFTYGAALLGLSDPDFLRDYGDMAKLVAKQYANWDRNDKSFPFLRTFDPWAGHSYAGGTSSGNGNNQESSSEAMQSWGGVFLLGSELQDRDMIAAGAMGYAVEGEAIREYWNNYDGWKQGPNASNWSPDYHHTIVGILGDSGGAFGTFFEGHPMFIYGIEWLPISPILSYLGRDPQFGKYQLDAMMKAQQDSVPGFKFSDLKTDWGNVTLGYETTFDPNHVAAEMDDLWTANDPIARDTGTGGLTYYFAHAGRSLGQPQPDYHTSIPTSQVYMNDGTHQYTAVIYNPSMQDATATVYHDQAPVQEIKVPARTLLTAPVSPAR
jgi:endoglucanase Acf2